MKVEQLLEYEFYDAEVGDGTYEDPHCTVTGVKNAEKLPADLEIPLQIGDDYTDYYVTEIADGVFSGLANLKSVIIPDAVKEIGAHAFAGCSNLLSLTLGSACKYLYSDAFLGCDAVKEVRIGDLAAHCETYFGNKFSNPMRTAEKVYFGGEPLGDCLVIPAKDRCNFNLRIIRKYAFCGCKIKELKLSEGIKNMVIESEAFIDCEELKTVTFSEDLVTFDPTGLLCCKSIRYNEYNGLKYLGSEKNPYKALVCAKGGLTSCIPHRDTEIICKTAFSDCEKLKRVYLPAKLKTIMKGAFDGCEALTTVTLSKDLYSFDSSVLAECKAVRYGEYNGLKYLGSEQNPYKALVGTLREQKTYALHPDTQIICGRAFENNAELSVLELPEGVSHIGASAFAYCKNLKKIYLPSTLECIGEDAFEGCSSLFEVHTPNAGCWCAIKFDCAMGKSNTTNPASLADLYFGDKLAEDVAVPQGVEAVGAYAFAHCKTVKRVTLPEGVIRIGWAAFNACSLLESVNIPDSVQSIDGLAFNYCKSLKSVKIPAVAAIAWSVFGNCASLESVSLTRGTQEICVAAFDGCTALKRIEIPDSVKKIADGAFRGCNRTLEIVASAEIKELIKKSFA